MEKLEKLIDLIGRRTSDAHIGYDGVRREAWSDANESQPSRPRKPERWAGSRRSDRRCETWSEASESSRPREPGRVSA
jgi:hypothetical protein